ncbi:unnamed protein product [Trichobilharzia regenti]|nr:unnamed protein product [Trichobilharzia regenti]
MENMQGPTEMLKGKLKGFQLLKEAADTTVQLRGAQAEAAVLKCPDIDASLELIQYSSNEIITAAISKLVGGAMN